MHVVITKREVEKLFYHVVFRLYQFRAFISWLIDIRDIRPQDDLLEGFMFLWVGKVVVWPLFKHFWNIHNALILFRNRSDLLWRQIVCQVFFEETLVLWYSFVEDTLWSAWCIIGRLEWCQSRHLWSRCDLLKLREQFGCNLVSAVPQLALTWHSW